MKGLQARLGWLRDKASRHPVTIAALCILALYLVTRLLFLGRLPIFYDESIFIRWSQRALLQGEWMVSLTDGKPPLYIWWIMPFLRMLKDPLIAGRVASVVAGACTLAGIMLLGRELRDWRLGLWAALLYVLCPYTLWYDRVAVTEGPLLALFVFAALFAVRAARTSSPVYVGLLGLTMGLGLMTKATAQLLFVIAPFALIVVGGEGEAVSRRRIVRWALELVVSYTIAIGIYSLLRFSPMFVEIGAKTAQTTKTLSELLRQPFDVFFSNAGTIFTTLAVFLTPLVFVAAIAGLAVGIARKWRPSVFLIAWVAAVWVIESLISKHWMFETILPRFFLCLVPPLLLGAGYAFSELPAFLESRMPGKGKRARATVAAVLIALTLAFPVYNTCAIIASPSGAVLPEWIRFQYLTGWPSGSGMEDTIAFIREESAKGKVTVGSNMPGIGLPTDALEMYFHDDENVEVVTFRPDARLLPVELTEAARRGRAYCVFNMFGENNLPPEDWPVEVVHQFPKGGGQGYSLFLLKVLPGSEEQ